MHEIVAELDTKLQATVSEEAADRIRVAATLRRVTVGQVVTELAMQNLPAPATSRTKK